MGRESQVGATLHWYSYRLIKPCHAALLQAIADKLIPGLGHSLRIVLVSQVTDSARAFEAMLNADGTPAANLSVLQHVIRGDTKRAEAMREFNGKTSSH